MENHSGKFCAESRKKSPKPLSGSLKKESDWIWTFAPVTVFQQVKTLLSTAQILQHLSPKKQTEVSADASSFGMGGVLLHKDSDGLKPVQYASRLLTVTEKSYAQINKEAVAMSWCCENNYH